MNITTLSDCLLWVLSFLGWGDMERVVLYAGRIDDYNCTRYSNNTSEMCLMENCENLSRPRFIHHNIHKIVYTTNLSELPCSWIQQPIERWWWNVSSTAISYFSATRLLTDIHTCGEIRLTMKSHMINNISILKLCAWKTFFQHCCWYKSFHCSVFYLVFSWFLPLLNK